MLNTYRIIPTYTGDVSGICSALYELGGMVVMHDPSGCNSTYNTHDETRWYDRESLIFISGLTEVDAILGNDQKFIDDILYAAGEMKPKFIALASAPIPYLNGTDFQGIARLIEGKTGIMTFFVPSNGTHDYSLGVADAFLELGKRIIDRNPSPDDTEKRKLNILGLTPLDFDGPGILDSLKEKLKDFEIISSWAMEDSIDSLKAAGGADVNLVVSVTGLKLARWMEAELGIPYVCGLPVGLYGDKLIEELKGKKAHYQIPKEEKDPIYLIGEPVLMTSLAKHIYLSQGKRPIIVNPLELDYEDGDYKTVGEEDLEKLVKDAEVVMADPLYKPILPRGCKFIDYSHEAFSGRCFRKLRRNLISDRALSELVLR